jgi:hypothetical protein
MFLNKSYDSKQMDRVCAHGIKIASCKIKINAVSLRFPQGRENRKETALKKK